MGRTTLLLSLLNRSPAIKLGCRHLVESAEECGLPTGEPSERRAVGEPETPTVVPGFDLSLCSHLAEGLRRQRGSRARSFLVGSLSVRGSLVGLSQTIDPIRPTKHDREEDEIDRHENVEAWWWRAVKAE